MSYPISFDEDFYYLYLHYYANTEIHCVGKELTIYNAICSYLNADISSESYKNYSKTNFICGLTGKKIYKLYSSKCGHNFEEYEIVQYVRENVPECPVCQCDLFDAKNQIQIDCLGCEENQIQADYLGYIEEEIYDEDMKNLEENYDEFFAWLN